MAFRKSFASGRFVSAAFILPCLAAIALAFVLTGCASSESADPAEDQAPVEANVELAEPEQDDATAAPSSSGALRVEGTQLVAQDGTPVQLRGVSTHGLAWFPGYVNQGLFNELRQDWGANVVRLALYTAESGGYCTDGDQTALLNLIDQGVSYATKADLYVVIDWHILSDSNPLDNKDAALEFFKDVSAEYADHDNVLYEICNEPNGATTWEDVKAYANEVIPVIRQNAPDSVIICGTPTWSQDVQAASADPLAFDNVMYTMHFYAATHKDDLRAKLGAAHAAGLPVFVSEFGVCDASGNGQVDLESADAWVKLMDELGVSYCCWNLSNKDEASALFNADCAKTSGFDESDLSAEGLWLAGVLGSTGFDAAAADRQQQKAVQGTLAGGGASAGVNWQVSKTNTWQADGKTYIQYSVVVTNSGSSAVEGWEVAINFTEAPELSDGWNGVYSTDGAIVTIRNASYNGAIDAGGGVGDIGFIVCGTPALALSE